MYQPTGQRIHSRGLLNVLLALLDGKGAAHGLVVEVVEYHEKAPNGQQEDGEDAGEGGDGGKTLCPHPPATALGWRRLWLIWYVRWRSGNHLGVKKDKAN